MSTNTFDSALDFMPANTATAGADAVAASRSGVSRLVLGIVVIARAYRAASNAAEAYRSALARGTSPQQAARSAQTEMFHMF